MKRRITIWMLWLVAIVSLGAIACSASSWAQQPPKAADQDLPPWVVHNRGIIECPLFCTELTYFFNS